MNYEWIIVKPHGKRKTLISIDKIITISVHRDNGPFFTLVDGTTLFVEDSIESVIEKLGLTPESELILKEMSEQ